MKEQDIKKEMAVKIVKQENVSKCEMFIWHTLEQENILRLEAIFVVPSLDAVAFAMPLQTASFFDIALEPNCMRKKNMLDLMKLWIIDILRGLLYLHVHGLCHLNMEVDNVLISNANSAVICDFTFLRKV